MICDFCSAPEPNPSWQYPARSFKDHFGSQSVGDWIACDVCHQLIEAGDRDGLAARVMLTPTFRAFRLDPVASKEYARRLHDGFFENRMGEGWRR